MGDKEQTLGEYRVGIDFNPSGNDLVVDIKNHAAHLIDLISGIPDDHAIGAEHARLKAHAMTLVEDAAMNAVKAATKRPREEE